jgi:hypothetical protein
MNTPGKPDRAPMRHYLQFKDLSAEEYEYLLARTTVIKKRFKNYEKYTPLVDRTLAMIFEKASTRTRVSFESGIKLLGLESSAYGSPLAIAVYALAGDEHIMLVLDRSRPSQSDAPVTSSRVTDQPAPAGVIYRHEASIHGIYLIELSTRPSPTLIGTTIVK